MKRGLITLLLAVAAPSALLAQSAAGQATVEASDPIRLGPMERIGYEAPGRFRLLFRVKSVGQDLPVYTIGHGGLRKDYLLEWNAYTSGGATCRARRQFMTGVDVFRGGNSTIPELNVRKLQEQEASSTVLSPTRPTVVAADFSCDGVVEKGDRVTVQIRFYFRQRGGWAPADYSFQELTVR